MCGLPCVACIALLVLCACFHVYAYTMYVQVHTPTHYPEHRVHLAPQQWYVGDTYARSMLTPPHSAMVDFRAFCFCHKVCVACACCCLRFSPTNYSLFPHQLFTFSPPIVRFLTTNFSDAHPLPPPLHTQTPMDVGFVCSVCLSIYCRRVAECSTCGAIFERPVS